jgi:hypothetical protein
MCFALPFIRREVRDNHTLLPHKQRKDDQIYLAGKASFTLKVAQGYKE